MTRTIRSLVALSAAVFALAAATHEPLQGQTAPPAVSLGGDASGCGSAVTQGEAQRYLDILARGLPDRSQAQLPPPYCVPVAGHIVRRTNGTGGIPYSQYYQSLADANHYFQGTGIQFYSVSVDFIDSDFYYLGITNQGDIDALRSTNVVPGAINVYYTASLPGLCGISSFTFSAVQGIVMANGCSGLPSNPTTMPHEFGHYFDLFHTHETAFGFEFVDGTNCTVAGDLLCDTPADPFLQEGVNIDYPACNYTGFDLDPNGDRYAPDESQIMSYTPFLCATNFSPQSQVRAVETLTMQRPGLLAGGCTPFGAPVITTVIPPATYAGRDEDVLLIGTNMGAFTTLNFGDDIVIDQIDVISPESLLVGLSIDLNAEEIPRDIVAVNAFDSTTVVGGLEILPTPVHYVSPSGAGLYPYATPTDAATTLSTALSAASDDDTVRVDSTAISGTGITVTTAVTIQGGWTDNFTSRNLPATRTTIFNNNLTFGTAGSSATIEGFEIRDGAGTSDVVPIVGKYGGGIRVINSQVTVRNCEIRGCDANTGIGFGGGGGLFATGSVVTIDQSEIHGNEATRGGGVYLYNTVGTIENTTVTTNTVATGGGITPEGAGLAFHNCPLVTLTNVTIDGNTDASNGGGIWAKNADVTLYQTTVSGNTTTFSGGGIDASSASTIIAEACTLSANTSLLGGALRADSSTTTTADCVFDGNSASFGAAVYAHAGVAELRHSLYRGNVATGTGGGIYVDGSTGEIAGNTFHENGGAAGGIYLLNSSAGAVNNIVSSSVGHGITCSGGAPALSYNLVFGSTGDDYNGCVPGTGAVNADPLFAGAAGGDFHLLFASPAIDAGDPSPAWNDPDGGRADMGWYGSHDFPMDQPVRPTGVATSESNGSLVVSWNGNPEDDVAYYAIFCDTMSGFVPGPATLVATTADTTLDLGPVPADTTWYVVCAVDTGGYGGGYSAEVMWAKETASAGIDVAPLETALAQNVPNPFNPTTTIRFSLAAPGQVTLAVYDVSGRRVRTLVDEYRAADRYHVSWDGRNEAGESVASGVYFYRLVAGRFAQTKKMVLLK